MLILGRKYKFTKLELNTLNKKFKNIVIIKYRDRVQSEILQEIEENIKDNEFNLIVLNTQASVGDDIIRYLINLQFKIRDKKIRIITIEKFMEEFLKKCYIPIDQKDLTFLENIKPYSRYQYILKKVIDLSIAIPLAIITSPIMLYSAYKIKKESPNGGIFFKQLRVGKNGKEFECIKFRSMHEDSSYFNHYTQVNDPRLFKWGKSMRKTRIDELPQLINVLKGEMHIIGPRAEWNELVQRYKQEIPYYNERHIVTPGITGWAQVMYPYGSNSKDAKQKLMYDLYYIKHWSLWLEVKTIWKTIKVVINRRGV